MTEKANVPKAVSDQERIVRAVYDPVYVKRDAKTREIALKYQTFRSPAGKDEVSVTRIGYSSPNFCKEQGKAYEDKANKRTYIGLAVLIVSDVRELNADVVSSPIPGVNEAHADIVIGYVPVKGQELPPEFKYMVETMAELANVYEDKDPDSVEWNSGELI